MNNTTTTVPTAQTKNQLQRSNQESDPLEALAREFGQQFGEMAGKRVGNAIAEEIHRDPEVRKAAAAGVGVGVGVVVGLGILALLSQ